ncbi:hypothetical protein ABW21_db0207054 [Orbilia brochopaga]|nr:hypothetical protein ABW21_db0207054 [Drechslerella brochopaga]
MQYISRRRSRRLESPSQLPNETERIGKSDSNNKSRGSVTLASHRWLLSSLSGFNLPADRRYILDTDPRSDSKLRAQVLEPGSVFQCTMRLPEHDLRSHARLCSLPLEPDERPCIGHHGSFLMSSWSVPLTPTGVSCQLAHRGRRHRLRSEDLPGCCSFW